MSFLQVTSNITFFFKNFKRLLIDHKQSVFILSLSSMLFTITYRFHHEKLKLSSTIEEKEKVIVSLNNKVDKLYVLSKNNESLKAAILSQFTTYNITSKSTSQVYKDLYAIVEGRTEISDKLDSTLSYDQYLDRIADTNTVASSKDVQVIADSTPQAVKPKKGMKYHFVCI